MESAAVAFAAAINQSAEGNSTESAETAVDGEDYQADHTLEEMMAAIRAAGGGKGNRPLRPQDL